MRATLSPMFTGSKMRIMYSHVGVVGKQSSDTIKQQILKGGENEIEFKTFAMKFTVDVRTWDSKIRINTFLKCLRIFSCFIGDRIGCFWN
jgi:hypothetical protein